MLCNYIKFDFIIINYVKKISELRSNIIVAKIFQITFSPHVIYPSRCLHCACGTSLFNQLPYPVIRRIFMGPFVPNQCFGKALNFKRWFKPFEVGHVGNQTLRHNSQKSLCASNSGKTIKFCTDRLTFLCNPIARKAWSVTPLKLPP